MPANAGCIHLIAKTTLMKKLNLLILSFIFAVPLLHAQDQLAGDHLTAINNAQFEMRQKYMAYMSAVAHGHNARKVEKMRQAVLESISNCKYKTIDIPIYKGDNSLRKSAIDYIDLCYKVFNEDYKQIVDVEEIAEQSFDEMQAYLLLQEKTNEKLKEAGNKMQVASTEFAKKYNITLVDSKNALEEKLLAADKLNSYRDKIYLVFFKCNWQDGVLTKAINSKSVKDIEQARSSLLQYVNEGMGSLDTIKAFQGDPSLANACKQTLQFYKKMADQDVPRVTDFLLKQEEFDKLRKNMESKADHSKKEVDEYNKSVKEINAAINTYNQASASMNNNRQQAMQNWENTDKTFVDEHMPRYQ